MATGSAARCTAYTGPHGSLHQTNVLITFISSSAGWIYPIDRFIGRALYEYYYDIDFTDCASQEEIQKRNKLLYESYCHLVATLLINVCRDYNIETTEIVRMIALVETKPELLECISQCHFNYIRAVYGIDHFGYMMMRYCNDYKLVCCKDEMRIAETNRTSSQVSNERYYWMYLLHVIESIGEKYVRIEEILSGRCLPVVEEMKAGPFVSPCGISLSDALQHREYQSTLSTLQEAHNQAKLAAHRLKQQDTMVKETSQENIPSDLLDVTSALRTLDGDPPATISPPKQLVTKRTVSARLSNEEVLLDSAPAKRGSFQKDILLAPPPSLKSKSYSPAESFQSSSSLKSKSHSSAESFQSSSSLKSKPRSSAESFQSSSSLKSKSRSPGESFQSSPSLKSKSHSSAESFQSSSRLKSKSHSSAESFQSSSSLKSKSHPSAESFQSSSSLKSKSYLPAESFQSSSRLKSKSHSSAESFQSFSSLKSKSHSSAESFQSSSGLKSKSRSPGESFQSSPSLKSKSHSPAESFQSSPSLKSKSCSPAESSRSSTETMSLYFKEVTISPQLAVELMQNSFQPIQYKALETYPDSDRGREEYLLHEYDRRLELHISYNAMKFITWNISENMVQLKSIIDNQAMFEQTWPSPHSKNEPASLFRKFYTNTITEQEEGIVISKLLKEAQSLIEQIQQTVNAIKS